MKIDTRLLGEIVRVILEVDQDTIQGRTLEFFGQLKSDGEKFEVGNGPDEMDRLQVVFFTEEDIESQSFLTKTISLKKNSRAGFILANEKPKFKPF